MRPISHPDAVPAGLKGTNGVFQPVGGWHPACNGAGWSIVMLRLLRTSRHAAAVTVLALFSGQWLSCSCAAPAIADGDTGHESTTVQDPHACCDTDGLRAGSTCCARSTLHRESAVIAPATHTDLIPTPAAHATGKGGTVAPRTTPVPALAAEPTRPPLSVILRI